MAPPAPAAATRAVDKKDALTTNAAAGAGAVSLAHLSGPMKAALWLLSVEETLAVGTIGLLDNEEVVRLRRTVDNIKKVTPEELAQIHAEFARLLDEQPLRLHGSVEYLTRLATQAMGDVRARVLMAPHDKLPPSAMLMQTEVEVLASVLQEEHPQVIAAVLATLSPQRASEVLLHLPEAIRQDIVVRVARLSKMPHDSLSRAQEVLTAGLPVKGTEDYEVDGVRVAATMLNQLQVETAENILESLGSETLSAEVRQAMFTFEDLLKLDKRGMQALLKEANGETLLMALKAASEELREKIFASLSKRAAEMMREDLEVMGPARLADVEKAQMEIVTVALKLRSEGKINVIGAGAEFV